MLTEALLHLDILLGAQEQNFCAAFDEMRQRKLHGKYGMVTMCVGTGQGAAGIFEFLN